MKIIIDGWAGIITFIVFILWASALLIQIIKGQYWPKKIIKKYHEPIICSGCGKPIKEHYYNFCSPECKQIVKDSIE